MGWIRSRRPRDGNAQRRLELEHPVRAEAGVACGALPRELAEHGELSSSDAQPGSLALDNEQPDAVCLESLDELRLVARERRSCRRGQGQAQTEPECRIEGGLPRDSIEVLSPDLAQHYVATTPPLWCRALRSGPLSAMVNCRCIDYRGCQGAAFATNASVASESFHLLSGQSCLRGYESSPQREAT